MRLPLTAILRIIGSSGGTTVVMIRMHLRNSLFLSLVGSIRPQQSTQADEIIDRMSNMKIRTQASYYLTLTFSLLNSTVLMSLPLLVSKPVLTTLAIHLDSGSKSLNVQTTSVPQNNILFLCLPLISKSTSSLFTSSLIWGTLSPVKILSSTIQFPWSTNRSHYSFLQEPVFISQFLKNWVGSLSENGISYLKNASSFFCWSGSMHSLTEWALSTWTTSPGRSYEEGTLIHFSFSSFLMQHGLSFIWRMVIMVLILWSTTVQLVMKSIPRVRREQNLFSSMSQSDTLKNQKNEKGSMSWSLSRSLKDRIGMGNSLSSKRHRWAQYSLFRFLQVGTGRLTLGLSRMKHYWSESKIYFLLWKQKVGTPSKECTGTISHRDFWFCFWRCSTTQVAWWTEWTLENQLMALNRGLQWLDRWVSRWMRRTASMTSRAQISSQTMKQAQQRVAEQRTRKGRTSSRSHLLVGTTRWTDRPAMNRYYISHLPI